jgi:hypothetical protein
VTTLEELAARAEIADVLACYAHACDRGDRALARACYHPDATDDHGRVSGTADEVFAFLARYSEGVAATWHFLGAPTIVLDGPEAADAETYCVYHREDTAGGPDAAVLQGLRYVDRFECRDGRWAIATRRVVLDWEHQLGPRPQPPAPDRWVRGSRDGSDPAAVLTDRFRARYGRGLAAVTR